MRRRTLLALTVTAASGWCVTACGGDDGAATTATVDTLPAEIPCSGAVETMARASDLEYRAGAPEKATLREPGVEGEPLVIQGYVLFPDCRAVEGAVLDVWHADVGGAYAADGYELRGVFRSDEYGRYRIETIVPGDRVVHVKAAEAPGGRIVTVEIVLPDDPGTVVRQDLVVELG